MSEQTPQDEFLLYKDEQGAAHIQTLNTISEQESDIEHSLKQSTAQRQNILCAAFCSQLVPQDPNDEPASVLQGRIRAERVAQVGGQKTRSRKISCQTGNHYEN